ncbi:uncharacterized protein LOC130676921 [Microplitis mediator]|uniref:uncharacterized protein LOC130676921 n=1 Tax=Microplitis mediator TaxID=375433 RepID=UPI002556E860|nr:uncharacterized protein LOC130676921 [Microplitis mediator]
MLHGPCGNWCLVNDTCSEKFPKNFRSETTMDDNGYPFYRRRDEGTIFSRNGHIFDNRHVVPYNPQLLKMFNCHINVEVVSSIRAVKYLYKYVYKGHDKAGVTISGNISSVSSSSGQGIHETLHTSNANVINHDEIQNFVDARYVGPAEAAWRIFSKKLQDKSHSIIRLPVHLPNEQSITISDDCTETDIQEALQRQTMLIDYFSLNERDPSARHYIYSDIPRYYVFKKDNETKIFSWQPRKKNFNVIERMYSVSPAQIELFHLRLLLINVKGATSFQSLRTVNETIYETYIAACLAAGLIEDDQEWRRTLTEAIIWMMPRQLRCVFVRILLHCQPLQPELLWDEFKEAMSEDLSRRFGVQEGEKKTYFYINSMLEKEGGSLSTFPDMPPVTDELYENDSVLLSTRDLSQAYYNKLNSSQKEVVDFVLNSIESNEPNFHNYVYIDGPGGSGKTIIYKTLYHILSNENKIVSIMAYTGIAATLLPNGKTVHKTFGLPVPMFSDSSSYIKPNSK